MKQELRFATSCDYSAWIAASAGTGKTRLLTNRIINLLLSGVDPRSILCLTFTKAAKGEMLARISNVLRNFTTQTEEEIREFFAENFEKSINNNEIQRIKDFYQKYISEGKVVEIYTIHAFCQNLLQKFPLEAGLRPYFKVIDETRVSRFIAKILLSGKTTLLIDEVMQNNLSLFTIKELIEELAQFYLDLDLGDKAIDAVNILLKDRLSAKSTEEIGILYNRLIAKIQENHEVIKQVAGLSDLLDLELMRGDNSDICQDDYINKLLSNVDIISFFLTLSGQKRKKLISRKDISKLAPQTEELLQALQDYIFTIKSAVDLNNGIEINSSILRLANFIFTEYKKYKEINNFLDYQDLINSSYNLLCNSDIKDWIKYKLDGGIEHILVDESQDTSQEQWNIIIALLEDFFSGDSRKYNKSKTIFVVGDVKQSIYSFQGARPDLFSEAKNYIKERALGAKARFIECNLEKTFRLPELIFNFVYRIFRDINLIENLIELESINVAVDSSVEIWNLVPSGERQQFFWPVPGFTSQNIAPPSKILAQKIARYIKNTIGRKIYIYSKQRPVQAKDFMILVQKRSILNYELYKEILKLGIEVSGLDRVYLSKSLIVKDLIAAAKFIIDPNDNLNLACLLKSLIFNLQDADLYQFKNEKSWVKYIETNKKDIANILQIIRDIYEQTHKSEFFLQLVQVFDIFHLLQQQGGEEQLDALKAFLTEIRLIFGGDPSLGINDIISLLEITDISIKRDFSYSEGVKITTIHGAKGLEAPIVILADSNDLNIHSRSNIIHMDLGSGIVPIISSKIKHEKIQEIKDKILNENYSEYLRLLYVALTRTQDHLVIAGIESGREGSYKSWYQICLENKPENFIQKEDGSFLLSNQADRYASSAAINIEEEDNIPPSKNGSAANKASIATYTSIEKTTYDFENKSTMIGEIFHKALEIFMQTPIGFDEILNDRFLKNLSDYEKLRVRNILKKCQDNKFLHYLANLKNESELEVAIADKETGGFKLKRLDLVAFNPIENEINIIDYKSDSNRNRSEEYKVQMQIYKDAMAQIYQGANIRLYIYWLRDDEFEEIRI